MDSKEDVCYYTAVSLGTWHIECIDDTEYGVYKIALYNYCPYCGKRVKRMSKYLKCHK